MQVRTILESGGNRLIQTFNPWVPSSSLGALTSPSAGSRLPGAGFLLPFRF